MSKGLTKLFIWGTGTYAEYFLRSVILQSCEILGALDSNENKQKTIWKNGIYIFAPQELTRREFDKVVIAIADYKDALLECEALGIDVNKIIVLAEFSQECDFIDYYALAKIFYEEKNALKERFLKTKMELEKKLEVEHQRNEIERQWYEDEKKYFQEEKFCFRALVADLENQLKHEVYKMHIFEQMAPYEFGEKVINIIPADQLLKRLITEKLSLSRFGDGEFELIFNNERAWFQCSNELLAKRLNEVLHSEVEGLLIGVADNFGNLSKYTPEAAFGIREYLKDGKREKILDLLGSKGKYYDAYVSRPYMMYRDKSYAKKIFNLFSELWKGRNILLIEGSLMKNGVGNDLFKTASSIRRILCPPINAFDYYDEIFQAINKNYNIDDLVLIALGPTATVLVYDICKNGMQAIDLGQLDNEYEWYRLGSKQRVAISGKAVPELSKSVNIEEQEDDIYISQIIERIGI